VKKEGIQPVNLADFFSRFDLFWTRCHSFKLFKSRCSSNIRSIFFCWACHKYVEQLAIDCKFFYVSIISTNNSQCRFFTVCEVQSILMYLITCMYLVCSLCILFLDFRAVMSVMHWPFCPAFISCCYQHVFYFVQINMDGWICDGTVALAHRPSFNWPPDPSPRRICRICILLTHLLLTGLTTMLPITLVCSIFNNNNTKWDNVFYAVVWRFGSVVTRWPRST